ncbi:lamin tail domain-containing protein [Symbioplanes lichenis]|uniref:lamin tail domain-containing protein n=1 Tax=Symbioplanes lichenis TaxID=1629072 RepID=UPI0027389165|nr:lamin tail domain-containing protein [Actinoplanes lichenis]
MTSLMRARATALAVTLGSLSALALAAPAAAAEAPTITVPASRQGYGPITISGTATPGATVHLYESAYKFRDFYPAPDYDNGGYITTTATSAGRYTLTRILDSGFYFYVKADGLDSPQKPVAMGIVPTLTVRSAVATVTANPAQPGLHVHVQRLTGTTWTDIATGETSDPAATFSTPVAPTGTYRAVIDPDTDNNLLRGTSPTVTVGTPAPAAPTTGAVQFTKIQYNSPKAGLNNEWVRVTNKTKATVDLKNWKIRDAAKTTYTFTTSYKLGAGKDMYIHTGKGTNGKPDIKHRYWNRTAYIWNNTGDTATLLSPAGKTIDTCKWSKGTGTTYC